MQFAYKKTNPQDLFVWASTTDAACFYCQDAEKSPLAFTFAYGKGICQNCLERFQIGHLEADRHVIEAIAPPFTNRIEAVEWFRQYGPIHFNSVVTEEDDDIFLYHFVYDAQKYARYAALQEAMHNGILQEEEELSQLVNCYTTIEIHRNGMYTIV